ncbi:MAG TPA: helix-turn-helix domain-containing protein [Gemmatimonadaceae bacterium]|nr:helix-turn-helix domain-containing protein [Gemmatimonadaceae bacterium]
MLPRNHRRRTFLNRLVDAGCPPPSEIIGWARLLVAAHFIEDPMRRVDRVAVDLDFPSGSALRNMLKRYTGLQPREVREKGGMRCVLEAFRSRFGQGAQAPMAPLQA